MRIAGALVLLCCPQKVYGRQNLDTDLYLMEEATAIANEPRMTILKDDELKLGYFL